MANSKPPAMSASSSHPLRLRLRPDVVFDRQSYQGRDYWIAKDPISLKYFRFEEEEYFLLHMLDGRSSPDHLKRRFDFEYAPQKITLQELYQFVGMLYRSCLLVSDETGQGAQLKKRGETNRQRQLRSGLSNILAIRFKGFDPDTLLTSLNRYIGWFFSWPAFFVVVLLCLGALGLVFSQFEQLTNKLPGFHEFFAAENWFWLAVVLGLTKVLHEFGHGLACKRFGGQCHEMGVMFLVLTPCLYCNVSDSWTLPNKWVRALIAAAGIYVELVLSAIATYVWWFSEPGMVNQLALNLIVVTSVSTLLFNANPLLRYDGYYILSDILEIPNLRQKASTILKRGAGKWLLGIHSADDPFLPARHRGLFAAYSLAAVLYRWLITFSIFWFLYRVMEPYGFKVIGQMIAMMAIWGLLGIPVVQLYKYFSQPGRLSAVNPVRVTLSAAAALLLLGGILLIPLPRYVQCCFIVQPRDAANLYVDVPGTIRQVHIQPNRYVHAGETILELENFDLEYQIEKLRGQHAVKLASYRATEYVSVRDMSKLDELDSVKAEVESAHADWKQRELDREKLTVRATTGGVLLAPPYRRKPEMDDGDLNGWYGTPLESRNLGAFLDQRTLVARIVPDPTRLEAVLAIDQGDIEFVLPDQPVDLYIDQIPGRKFHSQTANVSTSQMTSVPPAISSRFGGPLVTSTNSRGEDVPQSTTYLVSVPLENADLELVDGAVGKARIRTGSQTIGSRLWRLACRTFRFEM